MTHPRCSKFFYSLIHLFIFLSILGSIFLAVTGFLPIEKNDINIPLIVTVIATILTSLYNFVQNKWLDIDKMILKLSLKSLKNKKKIKLLIIDDFDRLKKEVQNELYILFNAIHESTRIIFIGDLEKLKYLEDNYITKIIDEKISLPFSLHSSNIALKIEKIISNKIEDGFDFNYVHSLFVSEKRTARDANQFLTYVDNELIKQNKVKKVQIDQQLFVIYLYLFHPRKYQKLVDGWLPKKAEANNTVFSTSNSKKNFQDNQNEIKDGLSDLDKYMHLIFQPREYNPADFRKNTSSYLINEFANNRSIIELRELIIQDGDELKEYFLNSESEESREYEEFLDFVRNLRDEEYVEYQDILEKEAVFTMKSEIRHEPNELIKFIFYKRSYLSNQKYFRQILDEKNVKNDEYIFSEFTKMFDTIEKSHNINILDVERMYYYRSCLNIYGEISYVDDLLSRSIPTINEKNVSSYFNKSAKMIEKNEGFGLRAYDAEVIIVQLGYHYWLDGPINPTKNPEFQSKIDSIEKLNTSEYKSFWEFYRVQPVKDRDNNIILQGGGIFEFDYQGISYKNHILKRLTEFG
ncbi:hypothetical protein [Streptococcus zalophi]|uniref:hypothetical protein n=1 Tax=Streptococcus zalophi TaxID=640031 RepID=UPI00215CFE48|nr:hypothetical protein [Streptococcus zalophi]MCR8967650.1 hypothetical protein [Streptococcus zalophi]